MKKEMSLKEIKEKFCIFVKDFGRQDFGQVVEFLKFVIAEFDDDSENIYKFLNRKRHNREHQARDSEKVKEIKKEKSDNHEEQAEIPSDPIPFSKITYSFPNICPVCEHSEARSSIYGPDVCTNCRNFFKRAYPIRNALACASNGRCECVGLRIACRKCRFKKCFSVGMRFKTVKRGRPSRENNRWPVTPEGSKCVGCEDSTNVRFHYGKLMCIKCAKWYSRYRYNVLKVKEFKCINTDQIYQNRCSELFSSELNKCSKCRYEKIISAIDSKL
uniref:Nuclear receptor n=1 Tax=Brachionus plicatilis TaxID=10195 RepID=A0A221CB34_BRAPC|nr:nuclear receptor [Brachionus plicatilis]